MTGARTLDGHGYQAGPLRPDWGEGWADLACDECGATWTGPIGEACDWCESRRRQVALEQAELVLRPPDIEPGDCRWPKATRAWRGRLRRAVETGLITKDEAERAWGRRRNVA